MERMIDQLRDERAEQVIFVSHCILNENTRYWGGAFRPAGMDDVVAELQRARIGIVQMRCPGQVAAGVLRQRLLAGFDARNKPSFVFIKVLFPLVKRMMRRRSVALARNVAREIREYHTLGFTIMGVVGISGSPFCGVCTKLDINDTFDYTSRLDITTIDGETFNAEMERRWVAGEAWFTGALRRALRRKGVEIEFFELDVARERRGEPMRIGIEMVPPTWNRR